MTELANISGTLPALSGHMATVSFSGCCAIFNSGVLVGNGALLWTGRHILTAARVVDGVSAGDVTLQFNTALSHTVPAIQSISIHPGYDSVTKFYEHNIAVITLTSEITPTLSRYQLHATPDGLMERFSRCVYGREINPLTGEYLTI